MARGDTEAVAGVWLTEFAVELSLFSHVPMRFLPTTHPHAARLAPTVLASALFACGVTGCGTLTVGTDDRTERSSSPNSGIVAGALEVKVDRAAKSLTLRNTTEFEVGYMVIEANMATVAMFPPCGAQCPLLAQGNSASVAYSAIGGYSAQAKEARVLWWTYTHNADGTRTAQGGVNTVVVGL